jgi:5'(3')-deoxyribonucleotidase
MIQIDAIPANFPLLDYQNVRSFKVQFCDTKKIVKEDILSTRYVE